MTDHKPGSCAVEQADRRACRHEQGGKFSSAEEKAVSQVLIFYVLLDQAKRTRDMFYQEKVGEREKHQYNQ
jgi:hypothetical protein